MTIIVPKDIVHIINKMDLDIKIEDIVNDQALNLQGLDSLDMTNLFFELEEHFKINITNEYFSDRIWDTIDDIVNNVNEIISDHGAKQ